MIHNFMALIKVIAIALLGITPVSAGNCASNDVSCQAEDTMEEGFSMLQKALQVEVDDEIKDDIVNSIPPSTDHSLGSLSGLGAQLDNGECEAHGIWTDHGSMAEIGFATNKSTVQLSFKGHPALALEYGEDARLLSLTVGQVKATTPEESETAAVRKAFATLAKEVDNSRMKRFSSTLGRNGLDGGKGPCLLQLHALLLSIAKLKELPGDSNMPSEEEVEGGKLIEEPEMLQKESRRRREDPSGHGWDGYGFNVGQWECPASMTTDSGVSTVDWECRVEPGIFARRRNSPSGYYQGGDDHLGGYHGDRYVNLKCRGGGGCSNGEIDSGTTGSPIQGSDVGDCKNGRTKNDCTGMCGAGCDCWESICGSDYKCGYIPECCAHDKTCARRRLGTRWKCLDAGAVRAACQNR